MSTSIETIHQELVDLKKDMAFIKHVLSEDFELSEKAKKAIKAARATPEKKYINLKNVWSKTTP